MKHEKAKRIAVRAIDRIVSAAKELAEAEALLSRSNTDKPTTNKHTRRNLQSNQQLKTGGNNGK